MSKSRHARARATRTSELSGAGATSKDGFWRTRAFRSTRWRATNATRAFAAGRSSDSATTEANAPVPDEDDDDGAEDDGDEDDEDDEDDKNDEAVAACGGDLGAVRKRAPGMEMRRTWAAMAARVTDWLR